MGIQALGFTAAYQGEKATECVNEPMWKQVIVIAGLNQLLKVLVSKICKWVLKAFIKKIRCRGLHEASIFLSFLLAVAALFVAFVFAANASDDTAVRITLSCAMGFLGKHGLHPVLASIRVYTAFERGAGEVLAQKRKEHADSAPLTFQAEEGGQSDPVQVVSVGSHKMPTTESKDGDAKDASDGEVERASLRHEDEEANLDQIDAVEKVPTDYAAQEDVDEEDAETKSKVKIKKKKQKKEGKQGTDKDNAAATIHAARAEKHPRQQTDHTEVEAENKNKSKKKKKPYHDNAGVTIQASWAEKHPKQHDEDADRKQPKQAVDKGGPGTGTAQEHPTEVEAEKKNKSNKKNKKQVDDDAAAAAIEAAWVEKQPTQQNERAGKKDPKQAVDKGGPGASTAQEHLTEVEAGKKNKSKKKKRQVDDDDAAAAIEAAWVEKQPTKQNERAGRKDPKQVVDKGGPGASTAQEHPTEVEAERKNKSKKAKQAKVDAQVEDDAAAAIEATVSEKHPKQQNERAGKKDPKQAVDRGGPGTGTAQEHPTEVEAERKNKTKKATQAKVDAQVEDEDA